MTITFRRLPLAPNFAIVREDYADGSRAVRFHLGWWLIKFSKEADRG
jgi:hypothetical protein